MITKDQYDQYDEEIKRPDVLRSCYNCSWLKSAISLWCSNKDAIKDRGTSIPGCVHCPHWSPDKSALKTMNRNEDIDNCVTVD